jgi:hypothetical protein
MSTGTTECAKIDGYWLGIPKQKWRSREQQEGGQNNCAKKINMSEWVEADASESKRRFASEEAGNISVSPLVKSEGE